MTVNSENTRSATTAEITSILVTNCGLDPARAADIPNASLEELGLDSLALLELQAVVAERYQAQIPEEARQMSISEIAALVDRRRGAENVTAPAPVSAPAPRQSDGADPPRRAESPPGHTENSILIAAPFELVWEMTNDVARWTELFTEYQTVEVLDRQGDTVLFRLTMFPDEQGVAWSWVSQRTPDRERREVHAHRVETGPFAYMLIHWRYVEESGGTRMIWTQDFSMKPTAPVDNAFMTDRINDNSKVQLKIIKERVERAVAARATDVPAGAGRE